MPSPALVITVFISRNTQRLINENKLYDYNIIENLNYKFIGGDENFYFRYNNYFKDNRDKINQKNYFGKKFLILSNK